ncbi:MAG: hypothetical protein ABDH32_04925 [Candidatus Caldarchaeales archaeon]
MPAIYLEEVCNLLKKIREVNRFEEHMRLYSCIKKYLAPASRSDLRNMEWDEELRLSIVKNYDRDLGIIRLQQ